MRRVLRRRRAVVAVIALGLVGPVGVGGATLVARAAVAAPCPPRTLVLSAMPIEIGPLLAQEKVAKTVTVAGRHFYLGQLRGHDVALAMSGIGPVNARQTTLAALRGLRCGSHRAVDSVVFSGVAGGDYIGNVTVPTRWTLDDGKHFFGVDPVMLATARRVARQRVALEQKAPAGDPACGCVTSPDLVATVTVTHRPRIEVGGAGDTTDPFSGRAIPCVPGGGDVAGCQPCIEQVQATGDGQRFATGVAPFVDPSFFTGYSSSTETAGKYAAEDEETAAVDAVTTAHHVPFLGFRAVSDGGGDPLGLPGFPVQFFYYRQLAADNAARATLAFLAAWPGVG